MADPASPERHTTQYYEMFGCRALYHEGWKAVTYHPIMQTEPGFDADEWELYHVTVDPSECHDLASEESDRLHQMIERWWVEAGRYQVLPLDPRPLPALVHERPLSVPHRKRYVYYPDAAPVPELVAVNVKNRNHRIEAHVTVPEEGAEGVLLSQGSLLGGWCFYVARGALHYVHNRAATQPDHLHGATALHPGPHTLAFDFAKAGEHRGRARLLADGRIVAEGTIEHFTPGRFSVTGVGVTCGYSNGLPVTDEIDPPFRFNGTIDLLFVEVDGEPFIDPDEEADAVIAMQ
jgi:arylsulfatase